MKIEDEKKPEEVKQTQPEPEIEEYGEKNRITFWKVFLLLIFTVAIIVSISLLMNHVNTPIEDKTVNKEPLNYKAGEIPSPETIANKIKRFCSGGGYEGGQQINDSMFECINGEGKYPPTEKYTMNILGG